MSRSSWAFGTLLSLLFATTAVSADKDYGTLTGQFVFEGDVPERKVIISKGSKVKDPRVCAANDVLDNTLLVDRKSKGIANIAIYLKEKPNKIHSSLQASKVKEVVCEQTNCRFIPHMMLVRTDQKVAVKCNDAVNHNAHMYPFANEEIGIVLQPQGAPTRFQLHEPEPLPMKVVCDLHRHMTAYWIVVDHPYAAVTDKDGKFTIKNLPKGQHTFQVWHERCGYVLGKQGLPVNIVGGEVTELNQKGIADEKLKLK